MPISRNLVAVAVLVVTPVVSLSLNALQQQNRQVLGELTEIRRLLEESGDRHDRVTLADLAGESLGDEHAPLTMIEFMDLQCPFCREYHVGAFERIKEAYVDTGRLRYFARDLPLDSLHPLALPAAQATHCAGDQGRFWEMRHLILTHNADLKPESFELFARELGIDVARFRRCASDSHRFDARWKQDREAASAIGVSATPSFVIGRSSSHGVEGVRIVGAKRFETFENELERSLRTADRDQRARSLKERSHD
jgi:protein-disulfide isomerase